MKPAAIVKDPGGFLRKLSISVINADKVSLMTKFKLIAFHLFPVFPPMDVSVGNSGCISAYDIAVKTIFSFWWIHVRNQENYRTI